MAKIKSVLTPNIGEDMERLEQSVYIVGGNKMEQSPWESSGSFLYN